MKLCENVIYKKHYDRCANLCRKTQYLTEISVLVSVDGSASVSDDSL